MYAQLCGGGCILYNSDTFNIIRVDLAEVSPKRKAIQDDQDIWVPVDCDPAADRDGRLIGVG